MIFSVAVSTIKKRSLLLRKCGELKLRMPELDQRDLIAASKLPKISNSILRNAIQSIPHDVISKNDLFDSVERLSELENIEKAA